MVEAAHVFERSVGRQLLKWVQRVVVHQLLLLLQASGPGSGITETIWSLALGKEEGRDALVESVSNGISEIQSIYPRLPIDREKTVQFVSNLIGINVVRNWNQELLYTL